MHEGFWVLLLQNGCQQVPQTCLANQLDDLTQADLARAAAGTTPIYLVGRYGGGTPGATQVGYPHACFAVLDLPNPVIACMVV